MNREKQEDLLFLENFNLEGLKDHPGRSEVFDEFCDFMQKNGVVFHPNTPENKFEAFKEIQIILVNNEKSINLIEETNDQGRLLDFIRNIFFAHLSNKYNLFINTFVAYIREKIEQDLENDNTNQQPEKEQKAVLQALANSLPSIPANISAPSPAPAENLAPSSAPVSLPVAATAEKKEISEDSYLIRVAFTCNYDLHLFSNNLTLDKLESGSEEALLFQKFSRFMRYTTVMDANEKIFEAFKAILIILLKEQTFTRFDYNPSGNIYNLDGYLKAIKLLFKEQLPTEFELYIDTFLYFLRQELQIDFNKKIAEEQIIVEQLRPTLASLGVGKSVNAAPNTVQQLAPKTVSKPEVKKPGRKPFTRAEKIVGATVLGIAAVFIVAKAINRQVYEVTLPDDDMIPSATSPYINHDSVPQEVAISTDPIVENEKSEVKPVPVEAGIAPQQPQPKKDPIKEATPRQKALAIILHENGSQSVDMTLRKEGDKVIAGCPDFERDKLFGYPDTVFNNEGVYESGSTAHCDYRFGDDPNGDIAVTLICDRKPKKVTKPVNLQCKVN